MTLPSSIATTVASFLLGGRIWMVNGLVPADQIRISADDVEEEPANTITPIRASFLLFNELWNPHTHHPHVLEANKQKGNIDDNDLHDDEEQHPTVSQGRLRGKRQSRRRRRRTTGKIDINFEWAQANSQKFNQEADVDTTALAGAKTAIEIGSDDRNPPAPTVVISTFAPTPTTNVTASPTASPTVEPATTSPTAAPTTFSVLGQRCMQNDTYYESVDLMSTTDTCGLGNSTVVVGIYVESNSDENAWVVRRNGVLAGCVQYGTLTDVNTFDIYGNFYAAFEETTNVTALMLSNCDCFELQAYDNRGDGLDFGRLFVSSNGVVRYDGRDFTGYSGYRSGWIPLTDGCSV